MKAQTCILCFLCLTLLVSCGRKKPEPEAPAESSPSPVIDEAPAAPEPTPVVEEVPAEPEPPPEPEEPKVNFTLGGTDVAVGMVEAWAAGFTNLYTDIEFKAIGGGPDDLPKIINEATGMLSITDREMTAEELALTEEEYGIPATAYRAAGPSEEHPDGLWIYAIKEERYRLKPAVKDEFLLFVFSDEGQDIAGQRGCEPLTAEEIAAQLAALEITYVYVPPVEETPEHDAE